MRFCFGCERKIFVSALLLPAAFLLLLPLCACASADPSQPSGPGTPEYSTQKETALINYSNELPEVSITAEEDSYSVGVEEIKVTWINDSPYDAIYGEYYELYKNDDGAWTQVGSILEGPYMDIAYGVNSKTEQDKTYGIFEWFGLLDEGEYKIYADYYVSIDGDRRRFVVSDGFKII
ncbi:MAG: hypothetical protein GXY05_03035 [Clostridiales bacterium]|nr:hypothetical protein [Clostridiales bacterium]